MSLVGPNGVGKTTLIEALAERRPLDGGRLKTGHNVKLGYLSQHTQELGSTGTALEAAQRAPGLTPGKARALLGQFLFSGEEAEKPLEGLSGGERRRLSLAVVVASGPNVLILDEPTNHLDLDAREALEDALQAFEGALLLVSHDRALLDAVGTRTVAFEDGQLNSYQGGWAEYARVREERARRRRRRSDRRSEARGQRPRHPQRSLEERGPPRGRAGARGRASRGLAGRVEDELADPAMWSSPTRRERATKRHADAKRAVEAGVRGLGRRARASEPGRRAPRRAAPGRREGRRGGAGQPRPGTDGASVQQGGFPARDAVRETLVGHALRDAVLIVFTRRSLQLKCFCVASTSP